MQILIISGFLGSGKTSVLMPFVKHLSAKGKKIAIIENEIGEIGVDDLYLKENGLHVKEIYHGCVCCNLRTDLIGSLIALERDHKPEVIVMEPTGVADPYQTLSALTGYPGYVESKTMVSIVDVERFEDIMELKIPLAIEGVKSADLIALNKIDLISPENLETLKDKIQSINPNSEVKSVSAHDEKLLNDLFELIESKLFSIQIKEEEKRVEIKNKGIQPSVCSINFEFTQEQICLSELETKKYFEDKVYKIALMLKQAGADLIGNLKLIIKSDKDGYLLVSTTSFTRYPEVTGKLPAGYSKVVFNMNAMVYGIEKKYLDSIVNQVFPYQTEITQIKASIA
jgi:G3E family GTPase